MRAYPELAHRLAPVRARSPGVQGRGYRAGPSAARSRRRLLVPRLCGSRCDSRTTRRARWRQAHKRDRKPGRKACSVGSAGLSGPVVCTRKPGRKPDWTGPVDRPRFCAGKPTFDRGREVANPARNDPEVSRRPNTSRAQFTPPLRSVALPCLNYCFPAYPCPGKQQLGQGSEEGARGADGLRVSGGCRRSGSARRSRPLRSRFPHRASRSGASRHR
jgi:hypothetical protein